MEDIRTKVNTICNLITELQEALEEENKLAKEATLELTDLDHWIEFSNFNVVDGYKAYKQLQDCCRRRRMHKDNVFILQGLFNCSCIRTVPQCIKAIEDGLENRKYSARVREDLFEEEEEENTSFIENIITTETELNDPEFSKTKFKNGRKIRCVDFTKESCKFTFANYIDAEKFLRFRFPEVYKEEEINATKLKIKRAIQSGEVLANFRWSFI